MTDKETILAFNELVLRQEDGYTDCIAYGGKRDINLERELVLLGDVLCLIDRLQAENDELPRCKDALRRANEIGMELQAENERLKNAYKQVAWERDVFAKDTREELTKHISICEAEKSEIKAEAYKECIEKVKDLRRNYTGYAFDKKLDNLLKETGG